MSHLRRALPLVLAGAAVAGAATGPTLGISKTVAHRGDKVAIVGRHWGSHKVVTLKVGRPGSKATALIARVTTNNEGKFAGSVPVKKSAAPGTYLIIACRKNCTIKKTRQIQIVP